MRTVVSSSSMRRGAAVWSSPVCCEWCASVMCGSVRIRQPPSCGSPCASVYDCVRGAARYAQGGGVPAHVLAATLAQPWCTGADSAAAYNSCTTANTVHPHLPTPMPNASGGPARLPPSHQQPNRLRYAVPHGYPLVTYSHVELANGTTCSGTEPHACDSGIQGFRGIGQNMCLESRFSTCAIWCFMGSKTGCPLSSATGSACSATGSAPRRHTDLTTVRNWRFWR